MRRLALLLVAVGLGCSRPRAKPVPVAEIAPPSASLALLATADAAGPVETATPGAQDSDDAGVPERRCAVAKVDYTARAKAVPGWEAIAGIPFGTCWSGPTSTWSISLELNAAGGEVVGLAVLHVDAGEKLTRHVRKLDEIEGGRRQFVEAKVFDFDGDGDPELYLAFTGEGAGCDPSAYPNGEIVGFHGGKIAPYAPAKGLAIFALKDIDKDGRPDIVTPSPFATFDDTHGVVANFAPHLVAHALPDGTFSRTDAVAVAAAKAICPRKPTTFPVDDGIAIVKTVGCARLWGMTAEAIGEHVSGESFSAGPEAFAELLAAKPPLTLR